MILALTAAPLFSLFMSASAPAQFRGEEQLNQQQTSDSQKADVPISSEILRVCCVR